MRKSQNPQQILKATTNHIYIYVLSVCLFLCIHIYMYRERVRERENHAPREQNFVSRHIMGRPNQIQTKEKTFKIERKASVIGFVIGKHAIAF